ncbi:MAG: aminotransferase class I/II-fold pyridoxal phosphate-dependent enzyme [Pseudomonadota bacterium]
MSSPIDTHAAEPIPAAAREEIERLLKSGDLFRYTAPDHAPVALLEQEFAAMTGATYALAVASCSAALFLSMKALGLAPGSKVAIPAFTFAAVPSAVVHAECRPVLVECGENYRIDMADFEAKLDEVDAILISHMRGHTSDMDKILTLAEARDLPVIEDAAHSLGTTWGGDNIGTLGRVGCFSFQSYKLLNAGEGGILVTDDEDLVARAVIMSGAYEHNWKKHPVLQAPFARWQNQLPLYNTRLSNLSAAVIRAQLAEIPRRVRHGRRNHDLVAARLIASPWFDVPNALAKEERAPDSIQFNLLGMGSDDVARFVSEAKSGGVGLQIFGASADNARAFWNWQFLGDVPDLPQTRAMLMKAADVRLPARLSVEDCERIASILLAAADAAMSATRRVA